MKSMLGIGVAILLALVALSVVRLVGWRGDRAERDRLAALRPANPEPFDPAMVAGLPEPARRTFACTIRPGTPLLPGGVIEMAGECGLRTRDEPRHQPMEARQILAVPERFVCSMRTRGGMPVSGSDSASWTRFRIFGLIPVGRLGGDRGHTRSAFGRYVAEATIWAPVVPMPGPRVRCSAVDADTGPVTVTHGGLGQEVDSTVDPEGRPVEVSFPRRSDANPHTAHGLRPF